MMSWNWWSHVGRWSEVAYRRRKQMRFGCRTAASTSKTCTKCLSCGIGQTSVRNQVTRLSRRAPFLRRDAKHIWLRLTRQKRRSSDQVGFGLRLCAGCVQDSMKKCSVAVGTARLWNELVRIVYAVQNPLPAVLAPLKNVEVVRQDESATSIAESIHAQDQFHGASRRSGTWPFRVWPRHRFR